MSMVSQQVVDEEVQPNGELQDLLEEISPDAPETSGVLLSDVKQQLLATIALLSVRLAEGKKGNSPHAGAAIKDVATSLAILVNAEGQAKQLGIIFV